MVSVISDRMKQGGMIAKKLLWEYKIQSHIDLKQNKIMKGCLLSSELFYLQLHSYFPWLPPLLLLQHSAARLRYELLNSYLFWNLSTVNCRGEFTVIIFGASPLSPGKYALELWKSLNSVCKNPVCCDFSVIWLSECTNTKSS